MLEMALELPSWLNIEFTQIILQLTELDYTINVSDILTTAATNKSDNYLSDMVRVVVDFIRKQDDKEIKDKKSLIFKFEPLTDGFRKQIMKDAAYFKTEIAMMTKTLKKMNNLLGSRLSANIFYVKLERPLCLIMEDLAPLGFRMADRQAGFDLAHSIIAIQGLAKFHASSVAVCEKKPKYKLLFNKTMFEEDQFEQMKQYWTAICMHLASEIEGWPELGKRYAEKIRNLAPEIPRKGIDVVRCREEEFNVINHGDCWVNNILFRYDENSKPIEQVFVDFQTCIYNSPAIDLHYLLYTSLSDEVYLNNLNDLYKEYLQTLTITMQQLGCNTLPPTMEELKRILKERALYALIVSVNILPYIMVDKEKAQSLDEIISENGIKPHPGLKSLHYRRIMSRRLPEFLEMGLLDV